MERFHPLRARIGTMNLWVGTRSTASVTLDAKKSDAVERVLTRFMGSPHPLSRTHRDLEPKGRDAFHRVQGTASDVRHADAVERGGTSVGRVPTKFMERLWTIDRFVA